MSDESDKPLVSSTQKEDSTESSKKRDRGQQKPTSSLDVPNNHSESSSKPMPDTNIAHTNSVLQNGTPTASPPNKKTASMQDFIDAYDAASKLTFAHEIAMNSQFKLADPNENSQQHPENVSPREKIENAVVEAMHRAFWDSLAEDLHSEPVVYNHAFTLLTEIKEILLSLLPTDRVTSLHKRINEALDIDLLKQQAENEALDIQSLTSFLVDTMASCCAPVRDADVEALRSLEDIVDLFKGIYKVLGAMKRDMVNFSIFSIRPIVQQQQVEYERKQFAQVLSKLPNGLERTEKWIEDCYKEMKSEVENTTKSSNASDPSNTSPNPLSPLMVLKRAFTHLLDWDKSKSFPETVLADQGRFLQLAAEFKKLLLVASVVLTTYSSLGSDLSSQELFINSLKEDLLVLLKPEETNNSGLDGSLSAVAEQVWLKTCEHYKKVNVHVEMSEQLKSAFQEQITSLSGLTTNPVYRVLDKRSRHYFLLVADHLARHKAATSPSVLLPTSPGLQVVSSELAALSITYAKLVNLNKTVYAPFYASVLRKALDLPQTPSTSPGNSPRDVPTTSSSSINDANTAKRRLDMNGGELKEPTKHNS